MPYNTDKQRELSRLVGEIQTEIDKFNRSAGKPYEVSISVGGSYGTVSSVEEVNELMRNTDRLMYEQKKVKKGERAPVFQPVPEAQKSPMRCLKVIAAEYTRYSRSLTNAPTSIWTISTSSGTS